LNYFHHFPSDGFALASLSIAGLLYLIISSFCEANHKESEKITISCLHICEGLYETLVGAQVNKDVEKAS
jgi:hypothetical protein